MARLTSRVSSNTVRVSRVLMSGPLAPFADAYKQRLEERRYAVLSAVNLQRQVAWLSRWLEAEGAAVEQLSEARVEDFLSFERASGRKPSSLSRPGLLCLLELLRERGVVQTAALPTPSPTEALMASFRCYLLSERGLSAGTVRGYVDCATRFVAGLGSGGVAHVSPADVTAAVLRQSAAVSVSAAQNFVAALRAFLRFCFQLFSLRACCRVTQRTSLSSAMSPRIGLVMSSRESASSTTEACAGSDVDRPASHFRTDYVRVATASERSHPTISVRPHRSIGPSSKPTANADDLRVPIGAAPARDTWLLGDAATVQFELTCWKEGRSRDQP